LPLVSRERAVVEPPVDEHAVLLDGVHRLGLLRCGAAAEGRDDPVEDAPLLGLEPLPVLLGVALGARGGLLPLLGVAPALLGLALLLVEALSEELAALGRAPGR